MRNVKEISGIVDVVNDYGIKFPDSTDWINYSKYNDVEKFTQEAVGTKVTLVVEDSAKGKSYIKEVRQIGEKVSGYQPKNRSGGKGGSGGGPRRFSPEELAAEASRIARSVGIAQSIAFHGKDAPVEDVLTFAKVIARFVETGQYSSEAAREEMPVPTPSNSSESKSGQRVGVW